MSAPGFIVRDIIQTETQSRNPVSVSDAERNVTIDAMRKQGAACGCPMPIPDEAIFL